MSQQFSRTGATLLMLTVTGVTIAIAYASNADTKLPPAPHVSPRPSASPASIIVHDCEDDAVRPPCATWDTVGQHTGWTLLDASGVHTPLPQCTAEDGGPTMPCLWPSKSKPATYVINYTN